MTEDNTIGSPKTRDEAQPPLLAYLCGLMAGFADQPASTDSVSSDHGALPPHSVVTNVDIGAWAAWTLVGLRLFSGERLPDLRALTEASRRVLLLAATERFEGNITRMARSLGTSRRALREQLKVAGIYGGPASSVEPPTQEGE